MSRQTVSSRLSPAQANAWAALLRGQFFKLIGGGSLTDTEALTALATCYSHAGTHCIDLAPDLGVLNAVSACLQDTAPPPLVMVSLPLDPDPHFRKIELSKNDCILCGACLPVCPTEAFDLTATALEIAQPLCYGCGRCVPVCPTEALSLHDFLIKEAIQPVLSHPVVGAVELHTQHADPVMLTRFLREYRSLLGDKLLAYCFRPDEAQELFWLESIAHLIQQHPLPVLLQIDGAPMSGSSNPQASLPALQAAARVYPVLKAHLGENTPPITISGGINAETAHYLKQPEYAFIQGVGMGTYARQHVWHDIHQQPDHAIRQAQRLVCSFQNKL